MTCPACGAQERCLGLWRGYYRFRCDEGHTWKIATPKRAAKTWAALKATRGTEA